MAKEKKPVNLKVERVFSADIKPIWGNYFRFTRLEDNFVLEVGYIDPQQVVDLQEKYPDGNIPEGENKIQVNIILTIGMSRDSFLKLKDNVKEIYDKSVEVGAIFIKEVSSND